MKIEFPKDSGRAAEYSDAESDLVRKMMAAADAAGVPRSQLAHELVVLHEFKVCYDARLMSDEERAEFLGEPLYAQDPDSPFQIPMSAR